MLQESALKHMYKSNLNLEKYTIESPSCFLILEKMVFNDKCKGNVAPSFNGHNSIFVLFSKTQDNNI